MTKPCSKKKRAIAAIPFKKFPSHAHIHNQDLECIRSGFSLTETLISLCLFFFIVLFSLEIFSVARSHLFLIKNDEESNSAAFSAMDKMKRDILQAGRGLLAPIDSGLLKGIKEEESSLIVFSKEIPLNPIGNLLPGQTRIDLESNQGIKKGRDLCLYDSQKGEICTIASVEKDSVLLSSPLLYAYSKETCHLILLKKVKLYLDQTTEILRRKVNSSPAQPLLEDVKSFLFDYNQDSNLIWLQLCLQSKKEKIYESFIYPKNTALCFYP